MSLPSASSGLPPDTTYTPDRACHARVISPHASRVAKVLRPQRLRSRAAGGAAPRPLPPRRAPRARRPAAAAASAARAQMRWAADWLERRPQLGREVFARGMPELNPAGRVGDLTELLRACLMALRVGGAGGRLWPQTAAVVAGQRRALPPAPAARRAARWQPVAGLPAAARHRAAGPRVARPRGALQHTDRRPGTGTRRRAGAGPGHGMDAREGQTSRLPSRRPLKVTLPTANYPRR